MVRLFLLSFSSFFFFFCCFVFVKGDGNCLIEFSIKCMFNYNGWNTWCEVMTIIQGKNLEFSMRLNWEIKIYMENKIKLYGGWMITDILILLVQNRLMSDWETKFLVNEISVPVNRELKNQWFSNKMNAWFRLKMTLVCPQNCTIDIW